MRKLIVALAAVFGAVALPCAAADLDCAKHLPFGQPDLVMPARSTPVCHAGYFAMHDDDALIPRYVAYELRGANTLGCNARKNNFHADDNLPEDHRATPKDYAKSGYDKGHQAPAADFVHSKKLMSDSFSMANMAPQKPGLNRKQWERLEETTRAWAWKRGTLAIYVGPIFGEQYDTIGTNRVAVPSAFFKIIVDVKSGAALAFVMPQQDIPKGKLEPWQTTVADIETSAGLALPLPAQAVRDQVVTLWPADIKKWNATRRKTCARKKR